MTDKEIGAQIRSYWAGKITRDEHVNLLYEKQVGLDQLDAVTKREIIKRFAWLLLWWFLFEACVVASVYVVRWFWGVD